MKANVTVNASKFEIAVRSILTEYSADVIKATATAVHEVADEAKGKLRTATSTPRNFKGTKYRRSWDVEEKQTSVYTMATVYNKKHYRLTHLLEFGHQVRHGGRKVGEAAAFTHIAPINDEVDKLFQQKMKDILGRTV